MTKAEPLHMVNTQLKGKVSTSEVFAWTEGGGQIFIYMPLVEGDTLQERWGTLSEVEREAVYKELNRMVPAWRSLEAPGQVPTWVRSSSLTQYRWIRAKVFIRWPRQPTAQQILSV